MPSNTNPDMLLTLSADYPDSFLFETFQAQTGFTVAPFSDDCTPEAINVDPADYDPAKTAFDVYADKINATLRHSFLSRSKLPENDAFYTVGRNFLKRYVTKGWKDWGFAAVTQEVMKQVGYEFYEFHKKRGDTEVSTSYLPLHYLY